MRNAILRNHLNFGACICQEQNDVLMHHRKQKRNLTNVPTRTKQPFSMTSRGWDWQSQKTYKAAFTRQTVGKHVGKLLATNRICHYSRQLSHQRFRVGKLVFDVWTISKRELLTFNMFANCCCVFQHAFANCSLSCEGRLRQHRPCNNHWAAPYVYGHAGNRWPALSPCNLA